MPQEFQVLKCYQCRTFQVHQVKKSSKWNCKMCGGKQSIKQVFGQGTGADCRHHVQKLNRCCGESEELKKTSLSHGRDWEGHEDHCELSSVAEDVDADQKSSRWQKYIEPDYSIECELTVDDEDLYTTERVKFDMAIKGIRLKKKRQRNATETETDDGFKRAKYGNKRSPTRDNHCLTPPEVEVNNFWQVPIKNNYLSNTTSENGTLQSSSYEDEEHLGEFHRHRNVSAKCHLNNDLKSSKASMSTAKDSGKWGKYLEETSSQSQESDELDKTPSFHTGPIVLERKSIEESIARRSVLQLNNTSNIGLNKDFNVFSEKSNLVSDESIYLDLLSSHSSVPENKVEKDFYTQKGFDRERSVLENSNRGSKLAISVQCQPLCETDHADCNQQRTYIGLRKNAFSLAISHSGEERQACTESDKLKFKGSILDSKEKTDSKFNSTAIQTSARSRKTVGYEFTAKDGASLSTKKLFSTGEIDDDELDIDI